jgi:hypothetical protein
MNQIIVSGTPAAPAAAPNVIVRPPVFLPEEVAISDVGENVEFRIGNSVLTFHYTTGLWLSQTFRIHSKRAKHRAGDRSRHWSAVGTLDGLKQ